MASFLLSLWKVCDFSLMVPVSTNVADLSIITTLSRFMFFFQLNCSFSVYFPLSDWILTINYLLSILNSNPAAVWMYAVLKFLPSNIVNYFEFSLTKNFKTQVECSHVPCQNVMWMASNLIPYRVLVLWSLMSIATTIYTVISNLVSVCGSLTSAS